MAKKVVDVCLIAAGAAIWSWAIAASAYGPGWMRPAAVVLLAASVTSSVMVSMTSRRRGWTVVTAWDDVLLSPVGSLLPAAPAVVMHLIGGLVTSVAAPGRSLPGRLPSLGRDAIAALVQVAAVSALVRLGDSSTSVVLAVLAGLLVRWVTEQLIVLVRARAVAARPGLARTTLVDPIMSFAPVGLLVGASLAMAVASSVLAAVVALLSIGLLWRFSTVVRQRDDHEDAAAVVALGEHVGADVPAAVMLLELEGVASRLWPNDRVVVRGATPSGGRQAWTVLDVAGEPVWLVLDRSAERPAPDRHDQRLLDALAATVNGALARQQLLETMRASQEIRGAVMAAVAHDIRAPLALLTGGVTTLRHHGPDLTDDQRDRLLGPIERAGIRMQSLVDDLLDLERLALSRPTDDLVAGHCLPRQVIEQAAGDLGLQSRLRLEASRDVPAVAMPSRLFVRVMENLLTNAAKHSPRDAPITVSLVTEGNAVRIHVDDHGDGVPAVARATIFAAFEQLDDHAKHQGVGLGLYVVGRFVKACGGTVWVDDAPTGGASFRVELPIAGEAQGSLVHADHAANASAP